MHSYCSGMAHRVFVNTRVGLQFLDMFVRWPGWHQVPKDNYCKFWVRQGKLWGQKPMLLTREDNTKTMSFKYTLIDLFVPSTHFNTNIDYSPLKSLLSTACSSLKSTASHWNNLLNNLLLWLPESICWIWINLHSGKAHTVSPWSWAVRWLVQSYLVTATWHVQAACWLAQNFVMTPHVLLISILN